MGCSYPAVDIWFNQGRRHQVLIGRDHGWRNREGRDREGPSPPGPINSISWLGVGGPNITIAKMGPSYFSWAVFQQLQ